MGSILVAGSEGEWAQLEGTLEAGYADNLRRGHVRLDSGGNMLSTFASSRDMWFHLRAADDSFSIQMDLTYFLQIQDEDLNTIVGLYSRWDASLGFRFTRKIETGAFTQHAESFIVAAYVMNRFDIRVRITTTNVADDTITYDFYVNEVLRVSETFVKDSAYKLPHRIYLRPYSDPVYVGTKGIGRFQDVIVTDAVPTVGMELGILVPNAVGTYTDFGNDYTAIDEAGYTASDAIIASAPAEKESWTFAAPSFTVGDKLIYAVMTSTIGQSDIGGVVTDFQSFYRQSSIDYPGVVMGANFISPTVSLDIMLNNPATGLPWAEAELSTIEVGVESS